MRYVFITKVSIKYPFLSEDSAEVHGSKTLGVESIEEL
jgi:hypothetical protein